MPVLTDGSPDTDSENNKLNPGQQNYDRRFNIAAAERAGGGNKGYNKNNSNSLSDIKNKEAGGTPTPPWKNDVVPGAIPSKGALVKGFANSVFKGKRGPILGAGGLIGGIGIILTLLGYSGLSLLPVSLTNYATSKNDVRGAVLGKRFIGKIAEKMTNASNPCDISLAECRAKKIPKNMLSKMSDEGIVAYNGDKAVDVKGDGYVADSDVPTEFRYKNSKGSEIEVASKDLVTNYENNSEFRKLFKNVFNMRYRGYTGRFMDINFFKKFGIRKNGGMAADSDLNDSTADKKLEERLKTDPDTSSESGAKKTFKEHFDDLRQRTLDKIKRSKGDAILTAGTAVCTAIGLPKFIASAYRAIQLAQLLVLVSDVVLSPGSMQQAGDADGSKLSAIGNILTERVKNPDNDQEQSAVDSPILQSAIGVNTNKVDISNYAPGFALLTNSFVQGMTSLSNSTKKTCNLINTPQAAAVVGGVEAAISTTVPGIGTAVMAALEVVGKIAFSTVAVDAAVKAVDASGLGDAVVNAAYGVAKKFISNYLDGARGRALGDALGVAILAFFSQAATRGGIPGLLLSQVKSFFKFMSSVDNEYREEDIATLSPFDISSQYTFLGSIMSNLSLHSTQGNPLLSGISMMGYVLKTPFTSLASVTVNAADSDTVAAENSCGYAKDFGLEETVAVNAAGFACAGIPPEYINMSPSKVRQEVQDDIDPETGEVKDDSDTGGVASECNPGELESISGCTVDGDEAEKRAAQSLYQLDSQIEDILSGEDDKVDGDSSASMSTVNGDSKMLAKKIIDSGKVTDTTKQLQEIADGTRTNVDNRLLSIIATLATSNTFTISSLKRDETLDVGAGQFSLHLQGKAVDLSGASGINGVSFGYTEHNSSIQSFLNSVAAIMPENCEIGVPNQTYVNATKPLAKSSCSVFVDEGTGPHVHLGVN